MNLEYFIIICMFIWIGLLIPFDPAKKNMLYKTKSQIRYILVMIGVVGVLNTIMHVMFFKTSNYTFIVFDVLSIIEIIVSTFMLVKFFKLKEHGAISNVMKIFASVLFVFSIVYSLLLSFKNFTPDLYLLFAPQFGVIMITSFEYTKRDNKLN